MFQICLGRAGVAAAILTQPPMAVECVLAEVVPAHSVWSEAAVSYLEVSLLGWLGTSVLADIVAASVPKHIS